MALVLVAWFVPPGNPSQHGHHEVRLQESLASFRTVSTVATGKAFAGSEQQRLQRVYSELQTMKLSDTWPYKQKRFLLHLVRCQSPPALELRTRQHTVRLTSTQPCGSACNPPLQACFIAGPHDSRALKAFAVGELCMLLYAWRMSVASPAPPGQSRPTASLRDCWRWVEQVWRYTGHTASRFTSCSLSSNATSVK